MSTQWTTLYKYVPLAYVESILDNNRLYLSDGTNFNDPFEITVTDKDSGLTKHVEGLHILCLTNSYRNKLIWSHYTTSHKGVCLAVKVPKHLVYPVCYSGKRVYSDSDLDSLIEDSTKFCKKNLKKAHSQLSENKRVAYIKDKKWSYEKEYRIVFDKNDESGLIFEDGKWYMSVKVSNVYLGVNFDRNEQSQIEKIINACKRNNIKITQMVLSKNKYSLEVKG